MIARNVVRHILLSALLLLVLPGSGISDVWAADRPPAGFVLMASGGVFAVEPDKSERKLRRKSPFYSGEILKTVEGSKAQVRFQDGALISMRAETEIRIDTFRFDDPAAGEDKNIFTLINGGFRTITGKIGKKNPANYRMKSSVASIGVRGTTYEVVLGDSLGVAAWQGTIEVENEGGRLTLGEEGKFNFAVVSSVRDMPTGKLAPPPAIRQGGVDDSVDVGADADSTSEKSSSEPDALVDEAKPRVLTDLPPIEAPTTSADGTISLLSDAGFVGIGGMGLISGPGHKFYGGLSHYNNGSLVITDNGLDPSDPGFYQQQALYVLEQGSAPLLSGSRRTFVIDSAYDLDWGVWNASAANPARLLDLSASNSVTLITSPVYWMSFQLTPNEVLAGLSATYRYQNVRGFAGKGSGGDVIGFGLDLSVDFNRARVTGVGGVHTMHEDWHLTLAGTIDGPILNFHNVSGVVHNNMSGLEFDVGGDIDAGFTGGKGQAIFGVFDLAAINAPLFVEGMFLIDRAPRQELRLTAAEAGSLTHMAIGAIGGPGTTTFMAKSTDGAAGSPVFALPTEGAAPGIYDAVIRQGAAPTMVATGSSGTTSWGAWNGMSAPFTMQPVASDPNAVIDISEPVYWMTVAPASATALQARQSASAVLNYATPITGSIQGGGTGGPINNASFNLSATIDFGSGAITGGMGVSNVGATETWAAQFDGTLLGPVLKLDVTNVDVNGSAGVGAIEAVLTGPTANRIGGAYDFSTATAGVEGVFLVGCTSGGC